jgi:hypothetical protein
MVSGARGRGARRTRLRVQYASDRHTRGHCKGVNKCAFDNTQVNEVSHPVLVAAEHCISPPSSAARLPPLP